MEQFKNLATTTLNGGIDGSTTSVVVASATLFPSTGEFQILIDSEIMRVTSVSGTTFTVVRGQEGTSAVSHSNGVAVTHVLTEAGLQFFRADTAPKGTHSSVATQVKKGRLLFTTDSPYIIRDDGSVLRYKHPIWKMKPPVPSEFTWVNQGPAIETTVNGGSFLIYDKTDSDDKLALKVKTAPSTPYTVTAYFNVNYLDFNFPRSGLCFRESSTSKIEELAFTHSTVPKLEMNRWNSPTSFNAAITALEYLGGVGTDVHFIRIHADGTNLKYSWSIDGFNFYELQSHLKTAFFTTAPDQIGYLIGAGGYQNLRLMSHILHFVVE